MKRRIGLLAGAALVSALGFTVPSSPASADTDFCAGTGVAVLSTGFGYPVLNPKNTANFVFTFTVGTCVTKNTAFTATGVVNGWCGLATGKGTTDNGHHFVFQSQGMVVLVTGALIGEATASPDPTSTGSCTNKTATRFLVNAEVSKTHHCNTYSEIKNKDLNTQARLCQG